MPLASPLERQPLGGFEVRCACTVYAKVVDNPIGH